MIAGDVPVRAPVVSRFGAHHRELICRRGELTEQGKVAILRRYERDADATGWHDGLLMDLLAEDLNQPD